MQWRVAWRSSTTENGALFVMTMWDLKGCYSCMQTAWLYNVCSEELLALSSVKEQDRIWRDNVQCSGTESMLSSCSS